MKNSFFTVILVGLLSIIGVGLSGCNALSSHPRGDSGYAELTPDEITSLVNYARSVIRNQKSELRKNQYQYIANYQPDVRISYRSDCYGRAIISWTLDKKTFRVIFLGDLTSRDPDRLNVNYSVVRETDQINYTDRGYGLKPELEINQNERMELKKK